jgi:SulP family sulfate permease
MSIKDYIPILNWGPEYSSGLFKSDLAAGLTVGVMLIPQGMAYAMIAGLPPIYGLYASTIPLIIYALLGTSRQLAVGPVAMVSLLTAAGVGTLAQSGTAEFIALAIVLALMVGTIQFLMGAFRLGFLVNFLSHPVISGFTSAAALIIGLSQLKHLLGIQIPRSHHVHEIIGHAIGKWSEINPYAVGIGLVGILIIVGIKKIHRSIPAQLVAVIFGVLAVWIGGMTAYGVKIVGDIPAGLPAFKFSGFELDQAKSLLPIALTIAFVSFMESIAVAKAIQAKRKNYKVSANQELMALGIANIAGSFFQSYPVTGGFSRTAVNDQAGAKTGMASIISAALVILTLLFLTPLFYYLPNAILASVILVAVAGLIDYKEAIKLWKVDRTDFFMLIITFFTTLAFGIEQGIGVGVILSLVLLIFRTAYPHHAELGQVPGTEAYRNKNRFKDVIVRDDLVIMRFDAQLYFANIDHFQKALDNYIDLKKGPIKAVILNFESINNIDSSGLHFIEEIHEATERGHMSLLFTGVKGPVRDKMQKSDLLEKIGDEQFFLTVQNAVDSIDQSVKENPDSFSEYTMQTNEYS